jgi:hypothetical protein
MSVYEDYRKMKFDQGAELVCSSMQIAGEFQKRRNLNNKANEAAAY